MRVVCDVDGVLLDFAKGMARYFNSKGLQPQLDEDPTDWNWNITDKDLVHRMVREFQESPDFTSLETLDPFAVETINRAFKEHDLWVITATPPMFRNARLANLKTIGFNIPDSRLITDEDKIPRIISLNPDLCIEDSPVNIAKLLDAKIPVCCPLSAKYSRHLTNPNLTFYSNIKEVI